MLENLNTEKDEIQYSLSLRSKNRPASAFEWDNPLEADGVPILARAKNSKADPNIKVTYNNFAVIQKTKAGYLANLERKYDDSIPEELINKYKEFDNLNNTKSLFKKMLFACAGWGNTFSLCYLDTNNRARIKQIPAWTAKVQYDDNGEPEKGYIYYKEEKKQIVLEYDFLQINRYEKQEHEKEYRLIDSNPHGFNGIPLIEWMNNDNKQGNAEVAVTLLDAYDRLMSDNITEWATFRSAYLVLKNLGSLTEEDKQKLDKTGIFEVAEDGDVRFVTKEINPEFVRFITEKTWRGIWTVANSVDPEALGSLENATAFQIAQMYRQMEEDAKDTELEWGVSLEYLDRLLKSYWTGLDTKPVKDYDTELISYDFVRNVPKDVMTWLEALKRAGGMLPQSEIFIKAGYKEDKAEELAEKASQEMIEALPSFE